MGAPCINDTCSVTSIIDPVTRRLEMNTRLSTYGSLSCNEDAAIPELGGEGLFVNIPDDVPVALSADRQAHNILLRHTDGTLYASLPHGTFERVVGTYVGVPHTYATAPAGDPSASSLNFQITNTFPHDALLLVIGNFILNYEVTNTGMGNPANGINTAAIPIDPIPSGTDIDFVPFNLNMAARLYFDASSKLAGRFESSGLSPNDGQFKNLSEYFAVAYQMSAGQVLTITDDALHDGLDQRVNVNTAPVAGGGSQVGFRTVLQHALLPIGQNVVGSANTGGI